jgi:hypothetical protein
MRRAVVHLTFHYFCRFGIVTLGQTNSQPTAAFQGPEMTRIADTRSGSIEGTDSPIPGANQDYLYSSYLRSVNKRLIFFAEEIVGCIIDIHYPEEAGRFICQITEYLPEQGWHVVKSVNNNGVAINFESNSTEEDFTDEVDLNAFWRERRIQFIGVDDCPYLFCPVCKWQAAPSVACIACSDCGHLTHLRCAARAGGIESIDLTKETIEEYTCISCCRHSNRSPTLGSAPEPHYSSAPASPTATAFDELYGWSPKIVNEVNSEFWKLQPGGARKFKFISGTDYLHHLCNGSMNHAMTALQHCSTAGVLSWVYEDGSESENCRIIKRGLDVNDSTVQLLVCVSDLSPTNQPRLSFKPPSQAWCCHMTYGFVAISGLLKSTRTRDSLRSQYGQILVLACRSTQARSIDELHSVVSERVWSNWTILDNSDGQLIDTVDQVQTRASLMYTVKAIPPPCRTPEEISQLAPQHARTGRRGIAAAPALEVKDKTVRQVLSEIVIPGGIKTRNGITTQSQEKRVVRDCWDSKRFTLVHRGLNHEQSYLPWLATPSRLMFGACMRLFQLLGYRVILLELALPISDEIHHHGQGREVEVVTSHGFRSISRPGKPVERDQVNDWPNWMPTTGDMVLASTSNTAAYKTYRAFGFGEHSVWNAIGCNASENYRYPVLGCVIEQEAAGGVSADDIRRVSLRKGAPLSGIASWFPSLKKRHSKASHEPSVVYRLLEGGGFHQDDPDTQDWMDSLHLFETVLDQSRPNKLGVSPMTLSPPNISSSPNKKQRRTR